MKTLILKLKRSGWYDFSNIPQEHSYIQINALNCGTDRKALNTAKRINSDLDYEIQEIEQ